MGGCQIDCPESKFSVNFDPSSWSTLTLLIREKLSNRLQKGRWLLILPKLGMEVRRPFLTLGRGVERDFANLTFFSKPPEISKIFMALPPKIQFFSSHRKNAI